MYTVNYIIIMYTVNYIIIMYTVNYIIIMYTVNYIIIVKLYRHTVYLIIDVAWSCKYTLRRSEHFPKYFCAK